MTFRSILRNSSETRAAACFLAPSVCGVILFVLWPVCETVRRSFTDARGASFQGLANYESVLGNSAFRLAAANTARFLCICMPLLLAGSLALALLVRAVRRGARAFRTLYLLPMAVPVASIAFLWNVLFHENGLCSRVLQACGAQPVDFMGTGAAFWVLIGTYLWKNSGYDMILWIAGLDGIDPGYYEAAAVDGAGTWQMFRRITLPALRSTLCLTAVLSLINSFKVFREAYLVAGAHPHESMYLLQHLFNNWFEALDMGRLTAAAVLLALALLIVLAILLRLGREDA